MSIRISGSRIAILEDSLFFKRTFVWGSMGLTTNVQPFVISKYDARTTFFTKSGTGHQKGDLYLCENRVFGVFSDGESTNAVLGIRTLTESQDDLTYITLKRVRPEMQSSEDNSFHIHKVTLRTAGKRGTYDTLALGYAGLHSFDLCKVVDSSLLDQIYQTKNSFRSVDDLAKIISEKIDIFLKKKRFPFDGIDKNTLENIACANGQTMVLLLERK